MPRRERGRIEKAALVTSRWNGTQVLLCRPFGNRYHLFPGGKLELGESPRAALDREIREELNCDPRHVQFLVTVDGYAHDGNRMRMWVYLGKVREDVTPSSEIERVDWVDVTEIMTGANTRTTSMTKKVIQEIDKRLPGHFRWQ